MQNTLDVKERAAFFDARLALVIAVRVLSVVFIVSGLKRWGIILGPLAPDGSFANLPTELAVATIFFSVADLVAAVGLWLLASWGTVVWLITALTEVVLHSLFRDLFGFDPFLISFHVTSVFIYALLTYLYERSRRDL